MSLDRRITDLERKQGRDTDRPLIALITPGRPAEPPDRFPSEAAMMAWCDAHDKGRPRVVVVPPGGASSDPASQTADPKTDA